VDGATKIGLDRLNWSQSLPSVLLHSGVVTVGVGDEYDIDVSAPTTTSTALQEAIALSMERNDNKGAYIFIGPCTIDNSAGTAPIYLNHSGLAHGVPLRVIGSGSAWYGSGTLIKSKYGIVVGSAFVDENDGSWLSDFYLLGDTVSPVGTGITCNGTASRINLDRMRVGQYDIGVSFSNYYNNIIQNTVIGNCVSGSIYILGNHNRLDNVIIAQPTDCPDDFGLKLVGYNNIVNIDIGVAGEETGSKGIWIVGDGNLIESCWVEPIATEGYRIYLDDAYRNTIRMDGIDQDAPYGCIHLYYSNDNIIDPNWMPSRGGTAGAFTNITFYMSFNNRILMSPTSQSAGRGVLNRTDAEVLDYGQVLRTAAPTDGYWYRGAVVWRSDATASQSPGWICTATGSPGTWSAMAMLT
jgi:hypothetical protein